MNSLGIIPARWSSTRFPGKPLHLIAGKPLLQHVWEGARRARTLDKLIIATDDMRIAEAAFAWGAEVAMTSPRHQSGTDRIAEVARNARGFAYIINIQGDEPLLDDPRLLDRLVSKLRSDPKIGMVTAAHPFTNRSDFESPHQVKVVIDRAGRALYFSRAAIPYLRPHHPLGSAANRPARPRLGFGAWDLQLPKRTARGSRLQSAIRDPQSAIAPLRHQGIYAFRRETLLQFVKWKPSPLERAESLEQLRALENGVTVHVLVTKQGSPGVDTPQDAGALERKLADRARKRGVSK